MMTDSDVLLDRIDLLLRDVGRAEAVLLRAMRDDPSTSDPVAELKEQQARYNLLTAIADGLIDCRGKLKEARSKDSEGRPAEAWGLYAEARALAEPLFGEILAFRVGALMRAEGLDDGLFPIADALIWELRSTSFTWPPIAVLAESEYLGSRARIIRLRFPAASIWHLPTAAHEFGHLVASELAHPSFAELAGSKGNDVTLLEEYFADVFATYALGPAFACTMLLLRFDPKAAFPTYEIDHPGDAKRAHCIVETLRRMEDPAGWGTWTRWAEDNLQRPWQASLTAAGRVAKLDVKETAAVEAWVDKVLEVFEAGLIRNVQYDEQGWARARDLAGGLRHGDDPGSVLDPKTCEVRDLLNAAWICRISHAENSDQARAVSDRAIDWCRTLIRMKHNPVGPPR
jgi:hypothetical protein